MTDLLILTDGGGEIGFGHIMRCLAIKNAWKYGTAIIWAQIEGRIGTSKGIEIVDWLENPYEIEGVAKENTVLLVDSYRPNSDFFLYLKKLFPFVAVLDDYNRIIYPVDLIICPGVYGAEMDYDNQSAKSVGGSEYVIIRPEIIAARSTDSTDNINSVLITFGGSQRDVTLYQYLNDIFEEAGYHVIVVTGNDQLANQLIRKKSRVYGRLEPQTMASLMASVDIAVSASGQTLNEFTWLGIPVFSFKTTEDQYGSWNFYHKHNYTLAAFLPNELKLEQKIISRIESLSTQNYEQLSERLKRLLTSSGAGAICSIIKKEGCRASE